MEKVLPKYSIDFKGMKNQKVRVRVWNNESGAIIEKEYATLKDETEIAPYINKWKNKIIKLNK